MGLAKGAMDYQTIGSNAAALDALRADLARIAADPNRRVYAVIDGASFDDLLTRLSVSGLSYRSTWRDVEDYDVMAAAPFLIDPYVMPHMFIPALETLDPAGGAIDLPPEDAPPEAGGTPMPADPVTQIGLVCDLIAPSPHAAVFWVGDRTLTAERMFKQARSLNRVLTPRDHAGPDGVGVLAFGADTDADDSAAGVQGDTSADAHRTHTDVLFRHGDGNVLAEVLPVLDAGQFARLFGPAQGVTFIAPDHPSQASGSALRRALRPADVPKPPAGPLRLDEAQMEALDGAKREVSRHEFVAFLREHAAQETAHLADMSLYDSVAEIQARGLDLGLESTSAHLLFVWLNVVIGPDVIDPDEFEAERRKEGLLPDEAMEQLFDGFIEAADKDAAGEMEW